MMLVFGIIFVVLFQFVANQTELKKYGPYKLDWDKISICKGPKAVNCGNVQLERSHIPTDILFITNIPKDCQILTAKIEVSTLQNNSTKKLWQSILNKPCQHFVVGPVLKDAYNLTNSCKINKGTYTAPVNADQKMKKFLGTSFFYGSYFFKVTGFNRACNIFCVQSFFNISKIL